MCSFLAYSSTIQDVSNANRFLEHRGPDKTTVIERGGWTFLHNLLSLTGAFTPQPFIDDENGLVCFFNGEIYNWKDINSRAVSDGEILIPMYQKHGASFTRALDGEFALALFDFKNGTVVLSTDPFATKPLWYAHENGKMGLASYESALRSLGFKSPAKVPANVSLTLSLADFNEHARETVFNFDPARQEKKSVDDFLVAFSHAIRKRAQVAREKVFIGLSSGYDSGAIASELIEQRIPFHAYSILGQEDQKVLKARLALLPADSFTVLNPGYAEYQKEKRELREICEPFVTSLHPRRFAEKNILEDIGAIGLGIIAKKARNDGAKIYLSGQGGDEILSDYRMHGQGLTGHSTVDGKFPDDLAGQFPWHNFYDGAQKFYIAKEEHVAGAYGIEARYPFLDKEVVQEFLYLSTNIKNAAYKYPLRVLFEKRGYPFVPDTKVGFVARKKTFGDYIARAVNAVLRQHI